MPGTAGVASSSNGGTLGFVDTSSNGRANGSGSPGRTAKRPAADGLLLRPGDEDLFLGPPGSGVRRAAKVARLGLGSGEPRAAGRGGGECCARSQALLRCSESG